MHMVFKEISFALALLAINTLSAFAQDSTGEEGQSESEFNVPSNEFSVNHMIQQFEEDNRTFSTYIKEVKRLQPVLKELQDELDPLKSANDQNTFSKAIKDFNGYYHYKPDFEGYSSLELKSITARLGRRYRNLGDKVGELNSEAVIKYSDKSKIDGDVQLVLNSIADAVDNINTYRQSIEREIESNKKKLVQLYASEEDRNIHRIAIQFGLPSFCLTILILFLYPYYIERKSANDNESATSERKQYLLDVATVLLLTMTILILGLAQVIDGEVLGTLLGGISGYVLNRTIGK